MSCRLVYLIASVMFIMYFYSTNIMDGWMDGKVGKLLMMMTMMMMTARIFFALLIKDAVY